MKYNYQIVNLIKKSRKREFDQNNTIRQVEREI